VSLSDLQSKFSLANLNLEKQGIPPGGKNGAFRPGADAGLSRL